MNWFKLAQTGLTYPALVKALKGLCAAGRPPGATADFTDFTEETEQEMGGAAQGRAANFAGATAAI